MSSLIIETNNFYPCPIGSILKYEGHYKIKDNDKYEVYFKILDTPDIVRVS